MAENIVYHKAGAAMQRYGQVVERNGILGGSSHINAATNFGVYKNHQLLIGQGNLYSYLDTSDSLFTHWVTEGPLIELQSTLTQQVGSTQAIISNVSSVRITSPFQNTGSTLTVSVWTNPDGHIYQSIQDDTTGTFLVNNLALVTVGGTARYPVLIAIPGSAVLFYVIGNLLYISTYSRDSGTPGFIASPIGPFPFYGATTAVIPVAACHSPYLGVFQEESKVGLVRATTDDQHYSILQIDFATGTLSTAVEIATTEAQLCTLTIEASGFTNGGTEENYGIGVTSQTPVTLAVQISGQATLYNGITAQTTSGLILSLGSPYSSVITAVFWIDNQNFVVYVGLARPNTGILSTRSYGPFNYSAWSGWPTYKPIINGLVPLSNGMYISPVPGITGTDFYFLAASTHVPVVTPTSGISSQTAFYIINQNGVPMQQLLQGTAYIDYDLVDDPTTCNRIIQSPQLTPNEGSYLFGLSKITGFTTTTATDSGLALQATVATPQSLQLSFHNQTRVTITEFNNDAIINCGGVFSFDGSRLVESGFYATPDRLSGQIAFGAGLDAGTYTYQAIYYWIDLQGNQFFSGTSAPLTVVITDPASGIVVLTLPTLQITRKNSVLLKIYRTTANSEGPFYPLQTLTNTTTSPILTASDTTPDVTLEVRGPFLYAPDDNSGEVPNGSPPGFLAMTATKTRVFGVSQEQPTQIWYTKPLTPNVAASWSGVFTVTVESAGGIPSALGALDTTLAIFKTTRLYTLPGDGPDANGSTANGSFGYPQLISSAAGCITPTSVGLTDLGLFFQSERGIEMLTRASAVDYNLGLPVYQFSQIPVTSVVSVPMQEHIRFGTNAGLCLVYDYVQQKWSTFTNFGGVGAGYWNGSYVRGQSDGFVFQEVAGIYTDQLVDRTPIPVSLVLETAWLKPNSISQGYSRIRRYAVFGTYKSAHLLRIDIGINYQDYSRSLIWNPQTGLMQLLSDQNYGEGSPYGEDAVYGGGVAPTYQLRARTPTQKCESMRWRFTTLPDLVSGTGEACEFIDLALELAQKTGLIRLQPGQTR